MSRPVTVLAILVCALIWGTTWFAITLQLGVVDPIVSIVWRFGLAAVVLVGFCALTRRPLRLSRAQHLAAVGQGAFVFAVSYGFVYAAEERVASAVVAVIFAALAFVNLVMFRLVERQKASAGAWQGAVLGICGVAVLSFGQLAGTGASAGSAPGLGIVLALVAVLASALGNWFAWRGQQADESLQDDQQPLPGANRRLLFLLGGGLAFMALVVPLGFVVPATLCGMGVARAFDAALGLKSALLCGAIATVFWLLFAQVLGVGLGPALPWLF